MGSHFYGIVDVTCSISHEGMDLPLAQKTNLPPTGLTTQDTVGEAGGKHGWSLRVGFLYANFCLGRSTPNLTSASQRTYMNATNTKIHYIASEEAQAWWDCTLYPHLLEFVDYRGSRSVTHLRGLFLTSLHSPLPLLLLPLLPLCTSLMP